MTPSTRRAPCDQHLARVAQVRGEEDDDRDLRELRRLEGDRPDADAEVGAVDLLPDARQRAGAAAAAGRPRRSCSGSARARGSRAGRRSSPRTGPARRRTTAPARARASRRSGRSRRGRSRRARRRAGTGTGRRTAASTRITRCAAQAQREEAGAVGQREVRQHRRLLDEDRGEAERSAAARPGSARAARGCERSLDLTLLERDHQVLGVVARAQLVVDQAFAAGRGDVARAGRRTRTTARRGRSRTAARTAGRGRS